MLMRICSSLCLALILLSWPAVADDAALRLTLPPDMYAVVGEEMNVYFDNIVLTETPEDYQFKVTCDVGSLEERRWTMTPEQKHLGEHQFRVSVMTADGKACGTATSRLHVVDASAGEDQSIRILFVGDSLTHASAYPNQVATLLSQSGNPQWTMLGTHKPSRAADRVAHEGYGGWTWARFVSHYEPNPDGTYRKRSSPFVFADEGEKPHLDVKRYFKESCDDVPPDYVFFLLGINDCFSANPDSAAAIDERIDTMLKSADTLVAAFREAAPKAQLAICLTTPPNSRESAFEANYKDRYHRWGWKRIQHRLVERLLKQYSNREDEHLFIVPTELNLDPFDGYPENNAVHPNTFGYQQIGDSMYAWLKWRLAQTARQ